ncbi:MAG: tetratricopeptide repeat protein [bacterium]|nr:tetratricopeptide repeat protein [bacterium]
MPSYQPHKHWIQYRTGSGDGYYPFALWREKALLLRLIGKWEATEAILRANLETAIKSDDERSVAQAQTDLSAICDTRGKVDEAFSLAQNASLIWEKLNDKPGLVRATGTLGSVYHHRSEYSKAVDCYKTCLELSRQAGLDKDICHMLNLLGLISHETDDTPTALKYYGESMEIARRNDDPHYMAMADGNTGNVYLELDQLDEAMECYQRALKESQRAGNKQAIAFAIGNIAIIFQKKGDYAKAMQWNRQQFDTYTEMGDLMHLAVSLLNMGVIYMDTGQHGQAIECFLKQIALSRQLNDKPILSYGSYKLGVAHSENGNFTEAQKAFDQSVEVARSIGFNHYLCGYLSRLAKLHLEQGRPDLARLYITEAKEIAARVNRPDVMFDLDVLSARLAATENKETAIEKLQAIIPTAANDAQKAEVLLQIYRLAGGEDYRQQAAELFRKLYDKIPNYQYKKTLAELT